MAPVASAPAPAPPAGAEHLFGPALPQLIRYADWLAGEGTVRGLLGPRETPRLWERHLINCAALSTLIPGDPNPGREPWVADRPADRSATSVVDIGSGAGLPGLVLALLRPDLAVTLVDATARRTRFLAEVVEDLDLGARVRVVTGRVEDGAIRRELGRFDVVTSRAVAPLGRLAGWCLPLLADGGTVLAMKGAGASEEAAAEAGALRRLHAQVTRIVPIAFGGQTTVVVEISRR